MKVIIPMAGLGKRFSDDGFDRPKPLIDINGLPMIEKSIDSLSIEGDYIFITRKTDFSSEINSVLKSVKPNCMIKEIDYVTEGPATTCSLVRDELEPEENLVIANCDQIMWWSGKNFINFCNASDYDGVIVTYTSNTTKNSFAKLNKMGDVAEVKEKEVISDISLNGIHFWKNSIDFINSYDTMVVNGDRAPNGEFYVGPSYNQMIKDGKRVGIHHIPNFQHHPVGTPDDLREYIRNENLQDR